jgi:hypothetical protein
VFLCVKTIEHNTTGSISIAQLDQEAHWIGGHQRKLASTGASHANMNMALFLVGASQIEMLLWKNIKVDAGKRVGSGLPSSHNGEHSEYCSTTVRIFQRTECIYVKKLSCFLYSTKPDLRLWRLLINYSILQYLELEHLQLVWYVRWCQIKGFIGFWPFGVFIVSPDLFLQFCHKSHDNFLILFLMETVGHLCQTIKGLRLNLALYPQKSPSNSIVEPTLV